MEADLSNFRDRLAKPWLVGSHPERTTAAFDSWVARIQDQPGPLWVADPDPECLLLALLAGVALQQPVIVASPDWTPRLLQPLPPLAPGLTVGPGGPDRHPDSASGHPPAAGEILIATGGTGGVLKFARHTWNGLLAAVEGYQTHWQQSTLPVVNLLPLHHVGGLVPALRSWVSGGTLQLASWSEVKNGHFPPLPPPDAHLSLVPSQLRQLLDLPGAVPWLRAFRVILVGGAALPGPLRQRALAADLPIRRAYGLTEAWGTVAVEGPTDPPSLFDGAGEVLPHWDIRLEQEEVLLGGAALFRGYWPGSDDRSTGSFFATGDLGFWQPETRLLWVSGRRDQMINTGGEKVNPAWLEAVIRRFSTCRDVWITGVADARWGQRVVAVIEGGDPDRLLALLKAELPVPMVPKAIYSIPAIPRNAIGKPDREALLAWIASR